MTKDEENRIRLLETDVDAAEIQGQRILAADGASTAAEAREIYRWWKLPAQAFGYLERGRHADHLNITDLAQIRFVHAAMALDACARVRGAERLSLGWWLAHNDVVKHMGTMLMADTLLEDRAWVAGEVASAHAEHAKEAEENLRLGPEARAADAKAKLQLLRRAVETQVMTLPGAAVGGCLTMEPEAVRDYLLDKQTDIGIDPPYKASTLLKKLALILPEFQSPKPG